MADQSSKAASDHVFGRSHWKASKFTLLTSADADDGSLLLYNSAVGAIARVTRADSAVVAEAYKKGFSGTPLGPLAELTLNGFFVDSELDEIAWASSIRDSETLREDVLELCLLPTEKCNFRCTYCYETFLRGKMQRSVIEGIINFVQGRSATLTSLRVGWFGGEPLTAPEVISEVATRLQDICKASGTRYSSSLVTNGYLLNSKMADLLFRAEVRDFQITLDGSAEDHNRHRLLAKKKSQTSNTFDRIFANLLSLRDRPDPFRVIIRLNFDPESAKRIGPFLDNISREFANDERFFVDFHPVGRWGGPNDSSLPVCGMREGQVLQTQFFGSAGESGLNVRALRQRLEPNGSMCYAANPRSFVIGSDGTIYKCTVAFEDPRNQVGKITEDGQMLIDQAKFLLWTNDGSAGHKGCQACFFKPSCHGNACPLERIRSQSPPCPSTKVTIDQAIRVVAADAIRKAGG
ncbi:radical SAM/SPASM domain-containing protein [Bradyrhizobium lablabi]|uniref:radical SAM/SPASM domain-containing protein n=1 Tax=Bradyrhizobium lablabi TaxID=722472 RepID=UPI001BA46B92|nr:radical SAM protein [Bradyrhizobium lablabi]MBR0696588.1 SPASM domain-containing protein [Bradyrhizobium lablabi]